MNIVWSKSGKSCEINKTWYSFGRTDLSTGGNVQSIDNGQYVTNYKKALEGRLFALKVRMPGGHKIFEFRDCLLVKLVAFMLTWGEKSEAAWIESFDGTVTVSSETVARLWEAKRRYPGSTETMPFVIRGSPILTPTLVQSYRSASLLGAIDFAVGWFYDPHETPLWVEVATAEQSILVSKGEMQQMHHEDMRAAGLVPDRLVRTRSVPEVRMLLRGNAV